MYLQLSAAKVSHEYTCLGRIIGIVSPGHLSNLLFYDHRHTPWLVHKSRSFIVVLFQKHPMQSFCLRELKSCTLVATNFTLVNATFLVCIWTARLSTHVQIECCGVLHCYDPCKCMQVVHSWQFLSEPMHMCMLFLVYHFVGYMVYWST